jgi:hypothetical protein
MIFSQLEQQGVENGGAWRGKSMRIQHYPAPRIQSDGIGYSSLGQMTDFSLALPRAANPEERIEDAVDRALADKSGVEKVLGQEEAQSSTPLDDSQIRADMDKTDYEKFSAILTVEHRSHFLIFSQTVNPLRKHTKMTPTLLLKFLYFLVFTRDLTEEKACDYFKIWSKYYSRGNTKKYVRPDLKGFVLSCKHWEYRHYRSNDSSVSLSSSRFVSACYLVFIAVRVLWVFEAIARGNELLTAEDRNQFIDRFTNDSENFEYLRGYWQKEHEDALRDLAKNQERSWKIKRDVEESFAQKIYLLQEQFHELANRTDREEDSDRLIAIRKNLYTVTYYLKLTSLYKMLHAFRMPKTSEKQEENLIE